MAVSQNGTLVYHHGDAGANGRRLSIVGIDSTERRLPVEEQDYFQPRVSPDGQRAVIENNTENLPEPAGPLLLLDLRTGASQRIAAPAEGQSPQWSRDGRRVAFLKFLGATGREIIARAWDRSGEDQVLLRDSSALLFDFRLGPAGGWSILRTGSIGAETRVQDILLAPAESLSRARPFVATTAHEVMPELSPDGRWLAYVSDEDGRQEVYVQPIPGPGPRLKISLAGGVEPLWSPKGGTLFYRSAQRVVMAARIETTPLRVAQWDTLFADVYRRAVTRVNWSVFPNGREFLMIGGSSTTGGMKAVVNWAQLPALQRSAAAPR